MKRKALSTEVMEIMFKVLWNGLIVFFIFSTIFFFFTKPTFNEKEHHCEEWSCNYMNDDCDVFKPETFLEHPIDSEGKKDWCSSWRPKTPEEKAIEHCKDNPNDQENCVCEEKKTIQAINVSIVDKCCIKKNGFHICANSNRGVLIEGRDIQCTKKDVEMMFYEEQTCLSARPKQKPIEINLEEEKCVEHDDKHIFISPTDTKYPCNKMKTEDKYIYDQYCCLKSEPLTECEKGNEKYTWYCERGELVNHSIGMRCIDSGADWAWNEGASCREKNPCELGNNEWVEEKGWNTTCLFKLPDYVKKFGETHPLADKCYKTTCRKKIIERGFK